MDPATVTAVSPLTVTIDGSATPVPALVLGSYVPVATNRVVVNRLGSQVVIVGWLGVETPPTPPPDPIPDLAGLTMGTPTSTGSAGSSSAGTDTRNTVLGNYTFTAVAGRRYRAVIDGLAASSNVAGDILVIRVRNGGGSTPTTGSPQVAGSVMIAAAGAAAVNLPVAGTFAPGAGTVTLGMFTQRIGGTGTVTPSGCELYAVDMGPS